MPAALEGRGVHPGAVEQPRLGGQRLQQHADGHARGEGVRVDQEVRAAHARRVKSYGCLQEVRDHLAPPGGLVACLEDGGGCDRRGLTSKRETAECHDAKVGLLNKGRISAKGKLVKGPRACSDTRR